MPLVLALAKRHRFTIQEIERFRRLIEELEWGPMAMPFWSYMADIGLAYTVFPIITIGSCALLKHGQPHAGGITQ